MTILFKGKGKGTLNYVRIVPPIPFVKPTKKPLSKEQYHTYKLRSSPTNRESPTYNVAVPYFGTGTCKEYLTFLKNFEKVKKGQNITSGANEFALVRRLLEGKALTAFKLEVQDLEETAANRELGFEAIAKIVFPPKAALTQKCYMRQFLRKQKGMPIHE